MPAYGDGPTTVAVDIGGTTIKAARTGPGGELLELADTPTPVAASPLSWIDAATSLIGRLRRDDTVAVGCAVPGLVDGERGVVSRAVNLGVTDALPVAALLRDRTGLPVVLDHDARAACRAEAALGAALGAQDAIVVVIGTGLSAGLLVDGTVVAGGGGAAGELGHVPVVPRGAPCACGGRGCVESYASASGMVRRYARLARSGTGPSTAIGIAATVGEDPIARQVWFEGCAALGRALVATVALLSPSVIVLGGGVSRAGALLRVPVQAALSNGLGWRNPPSVVVSTFGGRAGLMGAGIVAQRAVPGVQADGR